MHWSRPLILLPHFPPSPTLSMAVSLFTLPPSTLVPTPHLSHLLPRSMKTVPGPHANIQEGGTTTTASYGISPSSPPVSVSMTLSDAAPSQMMTAGTTSATVSSSGSIQSSMTAMSKSTAVASGSRTSRTANVRRRAFSWQKSQPTDLIRLQTLLPPLLQL